MDQGKDQIIMLSIWIEQDLHSDSEIELRVPPNGPIPTWDQKRKLPTYPTHSPGTRKLKENLRLNEDFELI